jgi:putative aldouronate transport system permease protein
MDGSPTRRGRKTTGGTQEGAMAGTRLAPRSPGLFLVAAALFVYAVVCIIPIVIVISTSLSSELQIQKSGYQLLPVDFSLDAYRMILYNWESVGRSYGISILITVVGTAMAVLITGSAGYTLANPDVKYRNALSLYFYVPTLISGGIVPWYLVNVTLGFRNNLLALVVPNLIFSVFNMYLVRNFMKGMPVSIRESARIDGANDVTIAFRLYFPLSLPVLGTITLFYALGYWNDWYNAVMLVDSQKMYPLQYMLFLIQSQIEAAKELELIGVYKKLPSDSYKMATVVITIGPIVLLYPFLQRYFVAGLTVGAVKG